MAVLCLVGSEDGAKVTLTPQSLQYHTLRTTAQSEHLHQTNHTWNQLQLTQRNDSMSDLNGHMTKEKTAGAAGRNNENKTTTLWTNGVTAAQQRWLMWWLSFNLYFVFDILSEFQCQDDAVAPVLSLTVQYVQPQQHCYTLTSNRIKTIWGNMSPQEWQPIIFTTHFFV